METKHTKGDWNVSKTVNDYAIHTEGSPKDLALVYEYSRGIPKEEAEANAKLIAAAPDLLKFAERVAEIGYTLGDRKSGESEQFFKLYQEATEVIRKATQL